MAHSVYLEARKQADDVHVAQWRSIFATAGGPSPEVEAEHHLQLTNASDHPIWLPLAYIALGDPKGYAQVRMFDQASLAADMKVEMVVETTATHDLRAKSFIYFRDARNRYWLRYIESGRYARGLRRKYVLWRAVKSIKSVTVRAANEY